MKEYWKLVTKTQENPMYLKIKAFFSANAYYSYIEKIELEQARIDPLKAHKDATKAFRLARLAFIVTAFLAGFSILLDLCPSLCP